MSRDLYDNAAEQSVLGALLLKNDALDAIDDRIGEQDFFFPDHRVIFTALRGLIASGKGADVVTLAAALDAAGHLAQVGGMKYLGQLLMAVPTAAGITQYAKVIADRRLERKLLAVAGELTELSTAISPVEDRLEQAQQMVYALTESSLGEDVPSTKAALQEFIGELEKRYETGETVTGLRTGLKDFDERLCGLQPGDLIVVGGRPSMGKTALVLQWAIHAALDRDPALVFSMEMSRSQLMLRAVSNVGRVNSQTLRTGKLHGDDWDRVSAAVGRLNDAPLFIDDAPGLSVAQMRARARRMKRRHGLSLIVIDYLQLMSGSSRDNRNEQLSEITRGLKLMARELMVPVVLLSQLNRGLESRPNKRPLMSDLRESGAIEQDADVIVFIYRDEVYNPDTQDKGLAELIVAKQRMGEIGPTACACLLEFSAFGDREWTPRAPVDRPPPKASNADAVFG